MRFKDVFSHMSSGCIDCYNDIQLFMDDDLIVDDMGRNFILYYHIISI